MATRIAAHVPHGTAARVLVVDDDAATRALCVLTLQLARSQHPDLAVLDVRMPRLDGFMLAAALRGDTLTDAMPFIFLSGETDSASQDRAGSLGASGYLTKPFDPRALETLVARVASDRIRPGAIDPPNPQEELR